MSAEEAQPESTAEKQCVDCGVVLAYATKKDKQRFRDHMVVHERERFTCDCDCEFADRCLIDLDCVVKLRYEFLENFAT